MITFQLQVPYAQLYSLDSMDTLLTLRHGGSEERSVNASADLNAKHIHQGKKAAEGDIKTLNTCVKDISHHGPEKDSKRQPDG